MNDLEHDLRELFEQRASGVDVPGLAPAPVLRRGRRRQIGTVVTAVLACLLALGVAGAAIGQARHPAVIPGGNGLPERTTSIGGVPVTAPSGWTLVDDWPLAAILPTSTQSCSFTSTGSAVSENGSPVDGGPSSPPSSSETGGQNCTTKQVGYGAGVPVLQLANFEVPVMETVCGLADQAQPAAIPDDGVAVYVADDQAQADIPALLDACAGNGASRIGEPQVFFDVGHHTDYIAVAFAGPDASAADIDTARRYVDGLSGLAVTSTAPASTRGPGYVVAAGSGGDTSWRLEAGIASFDRQNGAPNVGAVLVTTTSGAEDSRSVDLPTEGRVNDDSVDVGLAGVVQFGTATSAVTGIDIVSSSNAAPAILLRWPAGIRTLDGAAGPLDGWLWYAHVPEKGDVRATLFTGPTTSPDSNQASPSQLPVADDLQTRTTADGLYQVFGNDFGHNWSFTQERNGGSLMFSLDGAAPTEGFSFMSGSGTSIDIEGGTLELNLEPASVRNVWVTSDVQGKNILAQGRVAPPADYAPSRANIWVTALPGLGSGYAWSTERELPLATSWPTAPNTTPGKVVAAGITDDISWIQTWSELGCPTFEVIASTAIGDTGSIGCPVAWDAHAYPHSVSFVGGVYGEHHAVVLVTGPENMCADVRAAGDPQAGPFCSSSVADVAPWSATGEAIFVIPVGETWTIQPTQHDGTAFGQPITITARPGTIDIAGAPTANTASSSGSATAAASP